MLGGNLDNPLLPRRAAPSESVHHCLAYCRSIRGGLAGLEGLDRGRAACHDVKLKDFHAGYIWRFNTEIKNLTYANAKLTEECAAHREELSVCHARHSNKIIPKAKLESAGFHCCCRRPTPAKPSSRSRFGSAHLKRRAKVCPARQLRPRQVGSSGPARAASIMLMGAMCARSWCSTWCCCSLYQQTRVGL